MSTMIRLAAPIAIFCTAAGAAQAHAADDARIGIIGPDGEMQLLPTPEEMAEAASRGTDYSPFEAYAQRRLELASLISHVVYVDDDAPVGGDGTSWNTAHQSLQDALAQDYSDRFVEIRMAQGTYRPDRVNGTNTNDPEASFTPRYEDSQAPTGIFRITGGYAGLGAPDPDRKDPQQFRTVITGDLLGDDGPDFTNYDDNSLVLFDGFNSELHGLVLEHARQAMVGDGSLTIDGCVVRFHPGSSNRGAFRFVGDMLVVKRSTFYNNRSGYFGGAVAVYAVNAALVSNRFLSNEAVYQGGAVFDGPYSNGHTILQNNYFAGNAVRGDTGSAGGAAAIYSQSVTACNTIAFNRSEDGGGGGFGRPTWFLADHYTIFDIYHENAGASGRGLHEQFPSLPLSLDFASTDPPEHFIRGSFVQDWESSESNRIGSYASTLDSIRDNSGEEVLFVDLAGPDGIIGTPDDDPSPRPDSPNIDRVVDLQGAEISLLDFADLNENGIVDEPLPHDLLGNPRSINAPGIGNPNGGIDSGAIEYAGDPDRFDYTKAVSGQRIDPRSGCSGDEPIRLHVDASEFTSGDGSSWSEALRELTEALTIARTHCGPVEIWVAAGTYLPDFSVSESRASFRPTDNVTILGGFAGWEEVVEQRDPQANLTILSGDRYGNDDAADPDSLLDNAYRVVVASGEYGGGVIDGVTISGGVARARNYAGWMLTSGCPYPGPYSMGAAVTVANGEVTLIDCTISACGAGYGLAAAVTGNGRLRIRNLRVLDDQLSNGCQQNRSQVYASGVDSILARAAELDMTEVTLKPTSNTTPFGGLLGGNTTVQVLRSEIDFAARGSSGTSIGSGRISVREFESESSLLLRLSEIRSPHTLLNNCTVTSGQPTGVLFYPQPRPPVEERLTVSNSIVLAVLLASEQLLPLSEAFNSIYLTSNFTTRVNEIRPPQSELQGLFIDLRGPDGDTFTPDGDYRLAPGSPAINSGSNDLVGSDRDILGNDRIISGVVDRGAYEAVNFCDGDVTGDGVVNLGDLNLILANYGQSGVPGDASGDGVVDMIDLNYVLAVFGKDCSGKPNHP